MKFIFVLALLFPLSFSWAQTNPPTTQDIPALIKDLENPDPSMRARAIQRLGEIGPPAKDAVPALIAALKDPHPVSYYAILSLGRMGPAAEKAVPSFVEFLESGNASLRLVVLQALKDIGTPRARKTFDVFWKKLYKKEYEETLDALLVHWKKDFPDCFDYGGIPIRLLAEAYQNPWAHYPQMPELDGFDPKANWRRIVEEYPKSVVAPLAMYFLYSRAIFSKDIKEREVDWAVLIANWGRRIFPSVTSAYRSRKNRYPISGVRVGPIAQMHAVGGLGDDGGVPFGRKDNFMITEKKADPEEYIKRWKKVLDWYPNHLASTSSIKSDEWSKVVLIAYEHLFRAYARVQKWDMLEELAKRLLAIPNMRFGDQYEGESHPESLLALAYVARKERRYEDALSHLFSIAKNYPSSSFGYHGGWSDSYFNTALFEILSFPDEFADRGVEKLARASRNIDQVVFCYLQRACSLLSSNEEKGLEWARKAQRESPLHAIAFAYGSHSGKCFGYDWESDESPAMKKARKMLGTAGGYWSGVRKEMKVVLTSAQEWRNLWVQHTTGTAHANFVPPIDFSKFQVVGVFLGSLMHGPMYVGLRVLEKDKEIEVEYIPQPRGASIKLDGYDLQPWALMVIPKTNKPVVFKKKSE